MKRNWMSLTVVLVLIALIALAPASQSLAGGTERVLVEFAPGHGNTVRGALQGAGGRIHYQFDNLNLFAVSLPATAVDGIARNPNVVTVAPDEPRFPMAQ